MLIVLGSGGRIDEQVGLNRTTCDYPTAVTATSESPPQSINTSSDTLPAQWQCMADPSIDNGSHLESVIHPQSPLRSGTP